MALTLLSTKELNNGVEIPLLGLGVFRAKQGRTTENAVLWALEAGYRHIDTAHIYRNEADVGAALKKSGVSREEVFITTKLWNDDHGYDLTLSAVDKSLADLGLEHVDLYLMHWPVPGLRRDSWRAMEKALEDGRCRAIGVSNFTDEHLDDLLEIAKVVPAVNQIELHPYLQQNDTVAACRKHGIALQAYCPLTRGARLTDPRLGAIASALGKTPAQVLLRWSLQKGYIPLVKSEKRERIIENAALYDFSLDDAQMATIDRFEEGLRVAWDPTGTP